mgnify:FL=1
MVRKLVVNGETVVLSDEVLNKLRHQEYIEKGKRIVKTLGLNNIYNKMTDDDFAMIADDFIYMLNTTSDNISDMMETAVQKITQRVEERCNQTKEKDAKDTQKNMGSRELLVNGENVALSYDVINELHRQERIEEGKYMFKIFSSMNVCGKMTDDDFEKIVLDFEEMLNANTNELMAIAVQKVSKQAEKRYREQQEKINV